MFSNTSDPLFTEGSTLDLSNSTVDFSIADITTNLSNHQQNQLFSIDSDAIVDSLVAEIASAAIAPSPEPAAQTNRDPLTDYGTPVRYNGKAYLLTNGAKTWEDAQAEAEQLGGNLVTINNAAEDTWLSETFGRDQRYWMGLSDRQQEGVFTWASGEAVTYTNWAPNEPNDWQGTQDFGLINFGSTRQWDDEHDYTVLQGIIELETGELSAPESEDSPTLENAIVHNGSQYLLLDESLTWEAAQAEAEQLGGNLVTINNAAEDRWLQEAFGENQRFWMGLSDRQQEGIFTWASGEAVTYTNWAPNEPNDWQGTQDFGLINFGSNKQWDDEHNYTTLQGIVEIKLDNNPDAPPTIPEPEPSEPPIIPEAETPEPPTQAPVEDPAVPVDNSLNYNGSQYVLTDEALTWEEAQAKAQEIGGNLVTINNAEEDRWLQEAFGRDQRYWMGLSDRQQEGVFQWASGEALTYTNWAPNEPNDWQGTQDFGVINFGNNRQWDDEHAYSRFQGIIEINLDGSPTESPSQPIIDSEPGDVFSIYTGAFSRSVPDNYSGYNTNAVEISDWSDLNQVQALAQAVRGINAQTLRIPGGDTANYWDWDLGGVVQWRNEAGDFRPTWTYPYFLPESLPLALNYEYGTTASLGNLQPLFTESGAEPIWVVNMNTSDLNKEIRHLKEALALGFEVDRIELGNELYFGIQNYVRPDFGGEAPQVGGTPTAVDYAAQAKEWAIAIRKVPGLENATIAVTGVSPEHVPEQRGLDWWPALLAKTGPDNLSTVDVVDAFTLHPYYSTADLGITKSDVGNRDRAGEIARGGIQILRDTLADPALHAEELKGKELWITEHNIIEDAVVVVGGSWLQALIIDFHTQEFLKDERATVSTAHLLTGNAQWQGLTDENGLQIDGQQRGSADRPFKTDASSAYQPTAMGMLLGKSADIFDEGTATLLQSGEAFIAWQVQDGENGTNSISATNADDTTEELVLPEGDWTVTIYTGAPWATITGEEQLTVTTQTLTGGDVLMIAGFSKVVAIAQ